MNTVSERNIHQVVVFWNFSWHQSKYRQEPASKPYVYRKCRASLNKQSYISWTEYPEDQEAPSVNFPIKEAHNLPTSIKFHIKSHGVLKWLMCQQVGTYQKLQYKQCNNWTCQEIKNVLEGHISYFSPYGLQKFKVLYNSCPKEYCHKYISMVKKWWFL